MKKKQYIKSFCLVVLILTYLLAFTGCQAPDHTDSSSSYDSTGENPFSSNTQNEESVMFAYGIGLEKPEGDMVYDGQPVNAECFIDNVGPSMSVGLLIFIDGIPQPYKVGDHDETYMYIHEAPSMEKTTFPISFTPVCGKKGETKNIRFLSILNPQIRPDKLEYDYGHTNAMTTFFPRRLEIKEDVPDVLPEYSQLPSQRDMTSEEIEQVIYTNSKGQQINKLNIFNLFVRDANKSEQTAYIDVEEQKFTVEVQGFGGPSTKYILLPYLNHVLVNTDEFPGILTVDEGKKIFRKTFTFELTKLDKDAYQLQKYNTFYMLAIPVSGDSQLDPKISQSYVVGME